MLDNYLKLYTKHLADFNINAQVIPFAHGRDALFAILKNLELPHGSEIILPAYTCVSVADVIISLDCIPIYCDLEKNQYIQSIDHIETLMTEKTRVIIAQNTYGFICNLNRLEELAQKSGIKIIEDAAHGLQGLRNYQLEERIVFTSEHWSKPYPTGQGGMTITTDPLLSQRILDYHQTLKRNSVLHDFVNFISIMLVKLFLNPRTYWLLKKMSLNRDSGIYKKPRKIEVAKPLPRFISFFGVINFYNIREKEINRRRIVETISRFFKIDELDNLLYFPIRVESKAEVLNYAERINLEIYDWPQNFLTPHQGDLAQWGIKSDYPNARELFKSTILIPTHQRMHTDLIHRIVKIIKKGSQKTPSIPS